MEMSSTSVYGTSIKFVSTVFPGFHRVARLWFILCIQPRFIIQVCTLKYNDVYKVVLTFDSVDEILKYDYSNESY